MKKLNYLLVILLLLNACAKNDKSVISGSVKNFGSGEIYLIKADDEKAMDTIKVTNDNFSHELNITEPTVYMMNFGANQNPAFMILEPGKTTVKYEMNVTNSLVVEGGKEQKTYNGFIQECRAYFNSMDSLGKIAQSNMQNAEMIQSLQLEFFKLDSLVRIKQKDFVKKNPGSIAAAFLAANYLMQNSEKTYEEVNEIYTSLDKNIQESFYGKKIAEMATQLRNTTVGQPAPNFTLNDVNDKPVSLSSFKGKITLLDFWASWCGPCRQENPNVVAAYNMYHSKGFEILAVSLDDNKSNWLEAIKKDGLTWTHVSDLKGWQSSAAQMYGVQSIPTNFLLDKDGKILASNLRGEDLSKKLSELLP